MMGYFNVEEVLASMRTEATLRDHWITRAEEVKQTVTWRVCRCTRPCDPPCTKANTETQQHGERSGRARVYKHCMNSNAAIAAQAAMVKAGHPTADPKNEPLIVLSGTDKCKKTQFGGSFYPIYIRPGNLAHEVSTSEKAGHLWALLPVYQVDPDHGQLLDDGESLSRQHRQELLTACMQPLTAQLQLATCSGIRVVENGVHICTMYPGAWGHAEDRAELVYSLGTSYSWKVQRACGHCLACRAVWTQVPPARPPGRAFAHWQQQRRWRSQMLLLGDEEMEPNKKWGQQYRGALAMDCADPRLMHMDYDSYPTDAFHNDGNTKVCVPCYTRGGGHDLSCLSCSCLLPPGHMTPRTPSGLPHQ